MEQDPISEPIEGPIALFLADRARAQSAGAPQEAAAGVLSTLSADGGPSARFVLVKEVGDDGFFVYTNYRSRKAAELDRDPRAALTFHWVEIGIQYRVEGRAERCTEERSDAYFRSRPRESQLGAWASPQSEPIESREVLLTRFAEAEARYAGQAVPRPPHWGGYRIVPQRIERWVNGAHRLHDRFLYVAEGGGWRVSRLAP
jgi:pyridoxamine 5'-phosphate oxidase